MNNNLLGLKVNLVISDPWDLVSECGAGPFSGTIKEIDQGEALIGLDKLISCRGTQYFTAKVTARPQGKELQTITNEETVAVNMMFISTNEVSLNHISGNTLAAIGNIEMHVH